MKSDDLYKKQKKFFTRFLKENGIYGRYIRYIKNKEYYNCYQSFHEEEGKFWSFATEHGMQSMISMLITWYKTPEGRDFWNELSDKF